MTEVSLDLLKTAIESQHGVSARHIESVPVHKVFADKTVWEGAVHVFDLDGHPKATRAYAWSSPVEGSDRRRFYAVLHLGGIRSATDAVRAAIVAEKRRMRKVRRRIENDAMVTVARFWKKPGLLAQGKHTRPVDRQAAKDLAHKPRPKR